MSNLVGWDPFSDVRALPRFRHGFWGPRALSAWEDVPPTFAVDVSETEDDVEVRANLPGVDRESVDVSVEDGILTIKTDQKEEVEDKKREYFKRELRSGSSRRSVRLPAQVEFGKAEAQLKDGVLLIRFPKSEAVKGRKIAIETAS